MWCSVPAMSQSMRPPGSQKPFVWPGVGSPGGLSNRQGLVVSGVRGVTGFVCQAEQGWVRYQGSEKEPGRGGHYSGLPSRCPNRLLQTPSHCLLWEEEGTRNQNSVFVCVYSLVCCGTPSGAGGVALSLRSPGLQ